MSEATLLATGMCSLCGECASLPDAELCRACSLELGGALTEDEFDPSLIVPVYPVAFHCAGEDYT